MNFAFASVPELPEVETIVRELNRKVAGKKLSRFFVYDRKLEAPRLKLPSRVLGVSRRGKYVIFDLDCGRRCLVHLRMTGGLIFEPRTANRGPRTAEAKHERSDRSGPRSHERARFVFSDGSVLRFFDTRRFGTVTWPKKWSLPRGEALRGLPDLGAEPLSAKFTAKVLGAMLGPTSRAVKSALLDQKLIAGIGNIYADEVLWGAKIHPLREARSLTRAEVARLVLSIKKTLREAIAKGGTTIRDYRRADGKPGSYQRSRRVYDRKDLPCLRCGARIKKMKVGGRSSYFCPACQRI